MGLGTSPTPLPPTFEPTTETRSSGADVTTISTTSIASNLQNERAKNATRLRLEAEQSLRTQITTIVREVEKTATTKSTTEIASKVRTEQNVEQTQRMTPTNETTGFGLAPGRRRNDAEDTGNIAQRNTLNTAEAALNRLSPVALTTAINHKRDTADVTRATAKLQRRCNHNFSRATGECQYCKKKRSAHV